ncbi:GIY-YIG nuclease family protein [Corynebacterium hindlerae]|uniref:GIY-YIG nuclease family protein n=1 Tax=Corynebacterium hindlerae TaxID=699041 RepID=UPI0031B6FB72
MDSIAPLFPVDQRRGIYILEFENGEQYVGQALNVVTRFATHRHGSSHHKPWTDIVAIQFLPVIEEHLTPIEFTHIARLRRGGIELRNKIGNFGHLQPSGLDEIISVEEQEHWVLGQGTYGSAPFDFGDVGISPKLVEKLRLKDPELLLKILSDLRFALEGLVPNTPELESQYWTLSDYPSTAGGRFATFNLGVLEFVVFPRTKFHIDEEDLRYFGFINFPEGTLIPEEEWEPWGEFTLVGPEPLCFCVCIEYDLCRTDRLYFEVGRLSELFQGNAEVLGAARSMAIELMRQNKSNLFRRWHSRPLVRGVIESGA